MKKFIYGIFITGLAVFFIGCAATMESKHVTNQAPRHAHRTLTYFLPMTQIHLTATIQQEWQTNLLADNGPVWQSTKSNTVTVTTETTNINNALVIRTNTRTESITKKFRFDSNVEVIPHKFYKLEFEQVTVADPNQLYALELRPQATADDSYSVAVSTNGFLSSINSSNADQSGEIVKKIAQTAIQIYEDASGIPNFNPSPMFMAQFPKSTKTPKPRRIEIYFDPTSSNDVKRANSELAGAAWIEVKPLAERSTDSNVCGKVEQARNKTGGIYYRPAMPYLLTLNTEDEVQEHLITAPNKAPIFHYDILRSAFVTATTKLTLQNGYLTQVDYQKPSEILAIADVPLSIARSVASIPTNLIQLKIDYSSAQAKLYEAQASEITALTNLLQQQLLLQQRQATNK